MTLGGAGAPEPGSSSGVKTCSFPWQAAPGPARTCLTRLAHSQEGRPRGQAQAEGLLAHVPQGTPVCLVPSLHWDPALVPLFPLGEGADGPQVRRQSWFLSAPKTGEAAGSPEASQVSSLRWQGLGGTAPPP